MLDVKITMVGAQKSLCRVHWSMGPGPFQDLANAVNIDFLRILRLAGAQKKGEKKLAKDIRVRCVLIICWKMYMLEKNRFANFFLGSVNLPCCFAMLSKQNAFQALTNVEICWNVLMGCQTYGSLKA